MSDLFSKLEQKMNKKYLDAILKNKKGDRFKALDKMKQVTEHYGISNDTYVKEKFYLLKNVSLERYFTKDIVRARIDYIANKFNAPKGEVYSEYLKAFKKYNINLLNFAAKDVYADLSEENLSRLADKIKKNENERIEQLVGITGWDREKVVAFIDDLKEKYNVSLHTIIDSELFKKDESEIEGIINDKRERDKALLRKIKEENGWSEYDLELSRIDCRARYGIFEAATYHNLDCWKVSNEVMDTYAVPKDAFTLKDKYDRIPTDVLDNKTLFDKTFKDFIRRKFWTNKDTNFEEFCEFIDGLDEVFCKPINLLGGHGSYKYKIEGTPEEIYEHFMNEPQLLIEEIPKQHHELNRIYDKSINTIRVTSLLDNGEFINIGSWIKFGAHGSVVDGRVEGGCFAGVDTETGVVVTKAIDRDNNRFERHVDTGEMITGFQIPYWKEVLELTESALRFIDGIDFIGWDVAITENGPIIIEGNSKPALGDIQLLFNENHEGVRSRYEKYLK